MVNVKYQPRPVDVQWAQNVVNLIKDGGALAYPATKMIYQLDHKGKKLVLQNVEQLAEFESFVIHQQSKEVFKVIGYEVTEKVA